MSNVKTHTDDVIARLGRALGLALAEIDCGQDGDTPANMWEIRSVYADYKQFWEQEYG